MRSIISGLKIPLSVSKAQIGMASLSSMPCGECWCCWWFLGNEAEQTECSPVRFINWRKSQAMSSINWDNFWSNFRISIWPPWKGSHLSWLRTNITNTRGRVEFHRSSVIRVFPNHDLAVEKVPGHGLQYDHILFSKPLSIFFIKMAQINHASSCFLCHTLPGLGDERNRFLLFRLIALTKRFVQTIHLAQPQIRTCHTILTRLRSFSCKQHKQHKQLYQRATISFSVSWQPYAAHQLCHRHIYWKFQRHSHHWFLAWQWGGVQIQICGALEYGDCLIHFEWSDTSW